MDRRSWPWKKKSSDKSTAEKVIATLDSGGASVGSGGSQTDKDTCKKTKYVQISVESYTHLTGLENQVKTYGESVQTYEEQAKQYEDQVKTMEEEINELNEKLSSANSEITTKEELVKQHTKVAEEAVSGWEKAEAEALALKNHLESVTLAKLTVEDRAAHLDGALKECMRQIRNLKEENEQKLQEVAEIKNKQFDRMKQELEMRIAGLDQELMRAEAENAALSRSLQERSNMLMKINEEKSKAEAEIELLKSNIESCEREINSLKYELHIVSKELEIRSEEKNMSVKTADVASKQQLESVKKIAKLEAECQRLRGLVRKKLPGPAAVAQMKMEVESLGRDNGDTRVRRSPARPASPQFSSNPHMLPVPEFSLDGAQKFKKENEFHTERLFAMEEETKMLKEALAKRNSELQTSRSICAKTASKLQTLEAHLQILNQHKGILKADIQVQAERSSSQNASNPPSMTSLSENGNDDAISCAESWASALISELSHSNEKSQDRTPKVENGKHLELMDDFEEMEKLAGLSNDSNSSISIAGTPANKTTANGRLPTDVNGTDIASGMMSKPETPSSPSTAGDVASGPKVDPESMPLVKLQSRISKVFESVSDESDLVKILEDIKHAVQEVHDNLHHLSVNCIFEEKHCSEGANDLQVVREDVVVAAEKDITLAENGKTSRNMEDISQHLVTALSKIHNFVLSLEKEATVNAVPEDGTELGRKIEQFSVTFNKVLCNEISLDDFVFALSDVMAKVSELRFDILGYKDSEAESNSPDCIDKVVLPENRPALGGSYSNGCGVISDSSLNPEVPREANILSSFGSTSCKCTFEEFEQLKDEKNNLEREHSRCSQDLETAKSQLLEMEQLLGEVKSELASSQKMNGLAETQLKCMAASYKILEKQAEELESEVSVLRTQLESLENELQDEKQSHLNALSRCKNLEEQLQRNEGCSVCSSSIGDVDNKTKQEKDLAAAAEKLAECQETIFLLGKQLKSLQPQPEFMGSPQRERNQKGQDINEEPTTSGTNLLYLDQNEMDSAACGNLQRLGSESPVDLHNTAFSASDNEGNLLSSPVASRNPRHRPTKSGSSTASTPTPEKHARGFSRFFSSKGKNSH